MGLSRVEEVGLIDVVEQQQAAVGLVSPGQLAQLGDDALELGLHIALLGVGEVNAATRGRAWPGRRGGRPGPRSGPAIGRRRTRGAGPGIFQGQCRLAQAAQAVDGCQDADGAGLDEVVAEPAHLGDAADEMGVVGIDVAEAALGPLATEDAADNLTVSSAIGPRMVASRMRHRPH